ncbi:hypothetical protein PSP6_60103 [Paraburkholderia tropica]|nr:hypothetical protein PSP6_60103 [Paraburkholderia tropica]
MAERAGILAGNAWQIPGGCRAEAGAGASLARGVFAQARARLAERFEAAVRVVEHRNRAVADVVDPALQLELALRHASRDRRVRAQMGELQPHVFLDQRLHDLVFVETARLHDAARRFRVTQPGLHRRHAGGGFGAQGEALHRAAIGVAAQHDLAHVQREHREFDHGGHAAEHFAVGGHDVADVAADEQLAGAHLRDHLRRDARVGAGDEQRVRRLAVREAAEQLLVAREHVVTELVHAVEQVQQIAAARFGVFVRVSVVWHGSFSLYHESTQSNGNSGSLRRGVAFRIGNLPSDRAFCLFSRFPIGNRLGRPPPVAAARGALRLRIVAGYSTRIFSRRGRLRAAASIDRSGGSGPGGPCCQTTG